MGNDHRHDADWWTFSGFFLFGAWSNQFDGRRASRWLKSWPRVETQASNSDLRGTIWRIWQDQPHAPLFCLSCHLATFSAWAQDAVLEPFGAEVLHLPLEQTTRFNSYWQAATVVTLVGGAYLWRKRPPEQQRRITSSGLLVMALGMGLLGLTAVSFRSRRLVEIALLLFGAGFGVYTFGGLSLMAVMSSDKAAGAYLGLWTISVVVFKGLGTFAGGALRDLFLAWAEYVGNGWGYGLIFWLEGVGLIAAVLILTRVDVLGFAREMGRLFSRTDVQIASAD